MFPFKSSQESMTDIPMLSESVSPSVDQTNKSNQCNLSSRDRQGPIPYLFHQQSPTRRKSKILEDRKDNIHLGNHGPKLRPYFQSHKMGHVKAQVLADFITELASIEKEDEANNE
ncbi:hypothetical protein CR513_51813, partial [Mucuna pruriens]